MLLRLTQCDYPFLFLKMAMWNNICCLFFFIGLITNICDSYYNSIFIIYTYKSLNHYIMRISTHIFHVNICCSTNPSIIDNDVSAWSLIFTNTFYAMWITYVIWSGYFSYSLFTFRFYPTGVCVTRVGVCRMW